MALSQGVPFFMAGDEILRSKSEDRNSYDSGDWFNRIDWTLKSNNWGSGLPPANGNQSDWSIIGPALADANLKPTATGHRGTYRHMLEMLVIRKTSKLFRLRSADEIKKAVSFYNVGPTQTPGLIVERIANTDKFCVGASQAVVLVNATPQLQTFTDRLQEAAAVATSRPGVLAGSGSAHLEDSTPYRHVHGSAGNYSQSPAPGGSAAEERRRSALPAGPAPSPSRRGRRRGRSPSRRPGSGPRSSPS